MADFEIGKSFHIDDGELDGLSVQETFVLGYELAQINHWLKAKEEIRLPVHAKNRDRIKAACEDAGREFRLTWFTGDVSESWLSLEVKGIK